MSGSQKAVMAGLLAGLGGGMVATAQNQIKTNEKLYLMEAERMHAEGLARLKNQFDVENLKTEHGYRKEEVQLNQAGDIALEQVRSTNDASNINKEISGRKDIESMRINAEKEMQKEDIRAGRWSNSRTDVYGKDVDVLLKNNTNQMKSVSDQLKNVALNKEKRTELEQQLAQLQEQNVVLQKSLMSRHSGGSTSRAPQAAEAALASDPSPDRKRQFERKYGYLPEGL